MAGTRPSDSETINQVLAANLAALMTAKGLTQMALAIKASMGQTTVSLYLNPERRATGKSGKEPSAKLAEVQRLADALDTELWRLLQPPRDPAATLSAAEELGRAFDAVKDGDAKIRLYMRLMDEIRKELPSGATPGQPLGGQPILSQTPRPKTVRGKSRVAQEPTHSR